MDLAEVAERMRKRLGEGGSIGATVRFDFGPEGTLFVDDRRSPPRVGEALAGEAQPGAEEDAADCNVRLSFRDFREIAAGRLDPASAFMSGRVRVDNLPLAIRIAQLLR